MLQVLTDIVLRAAPSPCLTSNSDYFITLITFKTFKMNLIKIKAEHLFSGSAV